MKKDKYMEIKFKHRSVFGEYGLELFHRAERKGYKIKSLPFVYRFREEGSSKMGSIIRLCKLASNYMGRAVQLRFENLSDI